MPEASYFPRGISQYVATAEYAVSSDIDNRIHTVEFGALLALNTANILITTLMVASAAVTITAFSTTVGTATAIGFNGVVPFVTLGTPGGWGRALTMVASTANSRTVNVTGSDYLGQKMLETFTLNGTAAVAGKKAFAYIDSIIFTTGADTSTVNVGYGNVFGVPFAMDAMIGEVKNGATSANAATIAAAPLNATVQTATTPDARGTYLPVTTIPDGTNTFKIMYMKRMSNLHGNAQFGG